MNTHTNTHAMNTRIGRTKRVRLLKSLTRDERFFFDHAGYSYDPKTETVDEGRVRGAKELAKAEAFAMGQEYEYEWEWDTDADLSWMPDEEHQQEHEVLCCRIFNPREEDARAGKYATLEALGGIVDADANCRRVVEAELALEAMHQYDRETEVLDAH